MLSTRRTKKKRTPQLGVAMSGPTFGFVHVLPTVGSAEHILDFLALHKLALEIPLVEDHLVGACAAFEAVDICKLLLVQG